MIHVCTLHGTVIIANKLAMVVLYMCSYVLWTMSLQVPSNQVFIGK